MGCILVVDDEPGVLQFVSSWLSHEGYCVIQAQDGEAALHSACDHERDIELLLTDVCMPGMNGPELAERLKRRNPAMHILFMTGFSADALGPRAVVLQKPFTTAALRREVTRALKAAPQRGEHDATGRPQHVTPNRQTGPAH